MYPRDTIAAIATPAGAGGIAVVRVSGPEAEVVARRVFRGLPRDAESHRLYLGRIVDESGHTLDRGLCVLMRAPRSYTGEDVAELHGHGGTTVARSVLAAAIAAGARGAGPGEFTLRAFLNGKIDLAQAESVADLIAARTPGAMRVAAAQLEGELSCAIEAIRTELVGVAARLEVAIDFSEEDVGDLDREALLADLALQGGRIRALAATHTGGRLLREGARVAIVGKPNVGKSSLLNRLLRAERAIVTPVPGTTRDVLEETIDLAGMPVVLADTAGVRDGADEVERIGIERTRAVLAAADLVLLVLDGSTPLTAEDGELFDATRQNNCIFLINKGDLVQQIDPAGLPGDAPGGLPLVISARTGEGLDALRDRIAAALGADPAATGSVVVTRERHFRALGAAATSIDAAAESLRSGLPPDVVAVDVMAAMDHLGEIVGRTSAEDVLDRIFREFCIGK